MREIFFDRPGVLFSDGNIVKISLQSARPTPGGEVLDDTALLVCRSDSIPLLIELLSDFVGHQNNKKSRTNNKDSLTEINQDSVEAEAIEPEETIALGTMKSPHP